MFSFEARGGSWRDFLEEDMAVMEFIFAGRDVLARSISVWVAMSWRKCGPPIIRGWVEILWVWKEGTNVEKFNGG